MQTARQPSGRARTRGPGGQGTSGHVRVVDSCPTGGTVVGVNTPEDGLDVAHLVHELATPVASIRLALESLSVDPEDLPCLETALRAVDHISDLLGRPVSEGAESDLNQVVADAVRICAPVGAARGVAIDFVADEPTGVHGGRHLLMQVTLNILGNAIKFSPAGGIVSVRLDRDDQLASVTVTDQGPGVPADTFDLLQIPGLRLSRDADREGQGLGLSVSSSILSSLGGSLRLEPSAAEAGASITFSVPRTPTAR